MPRNVHAFPDPFSFWALTPRRLRLGRRRWVHPHDLQDVVELFRYHHDFLHTFPAPFFGPLKTAKLVLAYAGPGNTTTGEENDDTQGRDLAWVRRRLASFNGKTPIEWNLIQPRARQWFRSRLANLLDISVRQLDEIAAIETKIAFVNLAAYRGIETKWDEVAFLPSTQVMRSWARSVLFRDARTKKRVVVLMRANKWWGIRNGPWTSGFLFAPQTIRSGHLMKSCKVGQAATRAARRVVGLA
jgi:hypothetical protein